MPEKRLHMPDVMLQQLERDDLTPTFGRVWDQDFGTTWLIPSFQAAERFMSDWREGDAWFHDVPPNLVQWVACFPPDGEPRCPVFIECFDGDDLVNAARLLEFKKAWVKADTENPLEIRAAFIAERHKHIPEHGWTPAFVSKERLKIEVTPRTRDLYRRLGRNFAAFHAAAQLLAVRVGGSADYAMVEIREVSIVCDKILAIGYAGNAYASFIVGADLQPGIDQLD